VSRIVGTGSADGFGRATAQTLLDHGHEVVVSTPEASTG
jgi:NAD(P)-dependent dehydrogenase (short-subunit alcohol dehydrogenase family)